MNSTNYRLVKSNLPIFNFILLVDDDPVSNFLSEKLFCKLGCFDKVAITLNGKQALDIIDQECAQGKCCPDLILLDINMPVMTGFDFLEHFTKRKLKGSDKSKIIILTTSSQQKDFNAVNEFGIFNIIQKPLTETKLRMVLEQSNDFRGTDS